MLSTQGVIRMMRGLHQNAILDLHPACNGSGPWTGQQMQYQ